MRAEEETRVMTFETTVRTVETKVTPARSPSQVRTPVAALAPVPEAQPAVVPAATAIIAATDEQYPQGVSNGPPCASIDSGQGQQVPMVLTPASQPLASPSQPHFDEQQVRRFHELFQQAPWLYPGAPMMVLRFMSNPNSTTIFS